MSIADKLTRLDNARQNIANAIVGKGGALCSGFEDFSSAITNLPSGCEDIETSAEMEALLVFENKDKTYHYVGTTTANYINDNYYRVVGGAINVRLDTITGTKPFELSNITIYGINPDNYIGAFQSTNHNENNTTSACKVFVNGLKSFTLWINSYAESNYDYTICSKVDAPYMPSVYNNQYVKAHTRGFQRNPRAGLTTTYWKKVDFTEADGLDGGEHFIWLSYRKDHSTHTNDDRGYFIIEKQDLRFLRFADVQGEKQITANGTYDVANNLNAVVNVVPTGTISITENGNYDVGNYGSANVNVQGGGSVGYKLYLEHYTYMPDSGHILINDTDAIALNCNSFGQGTQIVIPDKVARFKVYGFDHLGTYPSTSSSWARYKLHSESAWTNIPVSRNVGDATEIVLTGDTDLQVFEATCLNKGTLITMADGSTKKIEDIVVGDIVKTYKGTGVVYKDEHNNRAFNDDRDVWDFENGYQVITTFQHRFYNVDKGKMMYMQEWDIGDRAITEDGQEVALINHTHQDIPCHFYSLWCDGGNCYYANGLLAGNRFSDEIERN